MVTNDIPAILARAKESGTVQIMRHVVTTEFGVDVLNMAAEILSLRAQLAERRKQDEARSTELLKTLREMPDEVLQSARLSRREKENG